MKIRDLGVCAPVGGIAHLLERLSAHYVHRSDHRSHIGEQIGDLFAVLDIGDINAPANEHLHADLTVLNLTDDTADIETEVPIADRKLQMVALLGIGHRTGGKKCAAHKGALLILVVKVGAVDPQVDVTFLVPVMLKDPAAFLRRSHAYRISAVASGFSLQRSGDLTFCLEQLIQ